MEAVQQRLPQAPRDVARSYRDLASRCREMAKRTRSPAPLLLRAEALDATAAYLERGEKELA